MTGIKTTETNRADRLRAALESPGQDRPQHPGSHPTRRSWLGAATAPWARPVDLDEDEDLFDNVPL